MSCFSAMMSILGPDRIWGSIIAFCKFFFFFPHFILNIKSLKTELAPILFFFFLYFFFGGSDNHISSKKKKNTFRCIFRLLKHVSLEDRITSQHVRMRPLLTHFLVKCSYLTIMCLCNSKCFHILPNGRRSKFTYSFRTVK